MAPVEARRQSAEERREAVLEAAVTEFAERGLHGASTDEIARLAGISQPYLFRLFGTKKDLYIASVDLCFRRTLEAFEASAAGLQGEEALEAMGKAYGEMVADRTMLRAQLQSYAACEDAEICATVRRGFGEIVAHAERVSGAPPATIARWFATGMLLNVVAAMGLDQWDEPWARRLIEGCLTD
jgi:AcrR family transcriptional regulator